VTMPLGVVVLDAGHVAVVSLAVSGNPEYPLLPYNNRLTDAHVICLELLQQLITTNRIELNDGAARWVVSETSYIIMVTFGADCSAQNFDS